MGSHDSHPIADLFPLMAGAEFDELVADIKVHGLRQPIVLYDGMILDGRNRDRACAEAGVEPRYDDFTGTHADAMSLAISSNVHRRHLTAEQKRELIGKLLKATPEKSDRQIADIAKASHHTVATVRTALEATGQVAQLAKTTGKDGRARPARKRPKLRSAPPAVAAAADPETAATPAERAEHGQIGVRLPTHDVDDVVEAVGEIAALLAPFSPSERRSICDRAIDGAAGGDEFFKQPEKKEA